MPGPAPESAVAGGWRRRRGGLVRPLRRFWQAGGHLPAARLLVGAALASHAVVLVVMARGWFFTGDDWDYLTRGGLGTVLDPHGGHVTAFVGVSAVAARAVAGLDYWPVYPLFVAVVWPAVAYAVWWSWRRSGMEPWPAATGTVVVAWLVTGAYIQFGHTALAMVVASFVAATTLDEERLTPGRGAASLALSLVAVLADSSGAVVTAVRGATSLAYRKWTGVVGAVPALVAYGLVRLWVGSDRDLSLGFGWGDLGTLVRVVVEVTGTGLRWLLGVPAGPAEVAGVVLLLGLWAWVLARTRLSYRAVTWFTAAAAFLGTVAVVRYLPRPWKLEALFSTTPLPRAIPQNFMAVRYLVFPVVLLLVLGVPLLAGWAAKGRAGRRRMVLAAAAVLLTTAGVARSVQVFDRISDKSVVKATEAAAIARLVDAGEPVVDPDRIAGSGANGVSFTFAHLQEFSGAGMIDGLLSSEIYEVRHAGPTPGHIEWARGLLRFRTARTGDPGTWAQVGRPGQTGCVPVDGSLVLEVPRSLGISIERVPDAGRSRWVVARWEDRFGTGTALIDDVPFGKSGSMLLRTAAPPPGGARVTIAGEGIRVCMGG